MGFRMWPLPSISLSLRLFLISICLIIPSIYGEIEVIAAGLGRTGTYSLQEALRHLGYETYHFVHPSHASSWAGLLDNSTTIDTLIDLIEKDEYTAVMDNPIADIYLQLHKRFPKAKVILTVRDNPQKFAQSWRILYETMEVTERHFTPRFPSPFQFIPLFRNLKKLRCFMGTTHLGLPPCEFLKRWNRHSPQWLEEQYERHNRHVMEHIPPEQLLVFNVKEGYEPLCKFLDIPVPAGPFPHATANSAQSLKNLRRIFEVVVYAWIPLLVAISILIAMCCGCMSWVRTFDEQDTANNNKYKNQ